MEPNTRDGRSIDGALGRRTFLKAAGLATVAGPALATAGRGAAQSVVDLTDWFANVSNYDGVVDERGADRVTVAVGATGNGGGFAFGPAAVRIDPGTTVRWEWTGAGGSHNVAAKDDSFESEMYDDEGSTFEHTFEADGVTTYVCVPHEAMGMKGAVVVGDVDVTVATPEPPAPPRTYVDREPEYDGWFDDVDNFEGTVDARGEREVRIEIGARGNGGGFAMDPPAVHVDPGTRVVWEWVGEDGPHKFVAEDGDYASPLQSSGEYALRFDGVGVSTYACEPHLSRGMKGAVVVGDVFEGVYELSTTELSVLGVYGVGIASPVTFGAFLWLRNRLRARSGTE